MEKLECKGSENKITLSDKIHVVFNPIEKTITWESPVFKFKRTNINTDDYGIGLFSFFTTSTTRVEFE